MLIMLNNPMTSGQVPIGLTAKKVIAGSDENHSADVALRGVGMLLFHTNARQLKQFISTNLEPLPQLKRFVMQAY